MSSQHSNLSNSAQNPAFCGMEALLGENGGQLQMNRLSLRNNRLKLETSGELPTILEGIYTRIYLKWMKAKPKDVNM